ncbi:MAG: pilin [Candidatus Pacebacteria bacterium]|nr:pilin [Candidatus Paceibacterota bacterium]
MKLLKILLTSFVLYLGVLITPHFVFALDNDSSQFGVCNITIEGTSVRPGSAPTLYASSTQGNGSQFNIRVCGSPLTSRMGDQDSSPVYCMDNGDGSGPSGQELKVAIDGSPNNPFNNWSNFTLNGDNSGCYSGVITASDGWGSGELSIDVELDNDSDNICAKEMPVCRRVKAKFNTDTLAVDQDICSEMRSSVTSCSFLNMSSSGDEIYVNQPVTVSGLVSPLLDSAQCGTDGTPDPNLIIEGPNGELYNQSVSPGSNLNATFTPSRLGQHNLNFYLRTSAASILECDYNFWVCAEGDEGCSSDMGTNSEGSNPYAICESNLVPGSAAYGSCTACFGEGGIWTAIGCISQDPKSLISKLINFGIGISGGIALIIILTSAFSLTISQGDVKKTSDAKEWLTAAIIGLLFIIFSVSILEFIGSTVLRIPGFGG